jgi:hypothetical protein
MDIEFHYYMTYLIAARAGFVPADAAIIAQSAQEIDDNHIPIRVSAGTEFVYDSVISQTMDILHPHHNMRIYPIFHFIPGDPDATSARRKDGLRSRWVTTPNSPLANEMLDTALNSGDLYRIGASAHAFADTWAHQNFTGECDIYNRMPPQSFYGWIKGAVPRMRIGHALAGYLPDIPGLIWTDGRLVDGPIDNTERFMTAADHLFRKLARYRGASTSIDEPAADLVSDLRADIGPSSKLTAALDPRRIARYKARALAPAYGGTAMPDYRQGKWADAAFIEQRGNPLRHAVIWLAEHAGLIGDVLDFGTRMPCTWRDPATREQTDWYKFQQAVRSHLEECWNVLTRNMPELKS